MEKVNGIGGFFFRAKDPDKLRAWYFEHLGVGGEPVWQQDDTDYFADDKQAMLNFRVNDLDALSKQLKDAGIEVETRAEWDAPEVGRFARIHDPEGNPIELWEPAV